MGKRDVETRRPSRQKVTQCRIWISYCALCWGVLCGILHNIDDGMWLIMLCKGGSGAPGALPLGSWLGGIITLSSAAGGAAAYQLTGHATNPVPFWAGQLSFYLFLAWAIRRVRMPRRSDKTDTNA